MLMKRILPTFLSILLLSPLAIAELDDWAKKQSRLVFGDKITHWGTGIGKTPEMALFKAEFMAVRGITTECGGIASKGIKVPKKKVIPHEGQYMAYARASIPFVECDYNKTAKAKTNKDLPNKYLQDGLKLYDKLVINAFEKKDDDVNLKKVLKKVNNYLKVKNEEYDSRLATIEADIKNLKNKPTSVVIHKKEIHLHGDAAKYEECIMDYNDLMDDAQRASYKNRVPGNLMGEKSRHLYNKAQRKLYRCQQIKKNSK